MPSQALWQYFATADAFHDGCCQTCRDATADDCLASGTADVFLVDGSIHCNYDFEYDYTRSYFQQILSAALDDNMEVRYCFVEDDIRVAIC